MSHLVLTAECDPRTGVLGPSITSFTRSLLALGYCRLAVRQKRAIVTAFARWAVHRRLVVARIDEATLEAYLLRCRRRGILIGNRRCTLTAFLEHLRAEGITVRPSLVRDHFPAGMLQERYATYLRVERGLGEETVSTYCQLVHEFVHEHFAATTSLAPTSALDAQAVRDFFLERTRTLAATTAQSLATAFRSFLRFLFLRGDTTVDLARAIPTVRRWRQAKVHAYLRPEEVERLLDSCDRTTARGCRNHAILLLLARLGLRAREVAALEVGDIRWRSGEILVHGKGGVLARLPLLPDVGAALASYLRHGRPSSPCRRIFLRNLAPRIGLNADAVGIVVRRTLARAGLRPRHCGSHILRFSLATTMLRRGASMAEIAEVLRHRSPETTEIYAKVDFEALRAVALPWPSLGGAL
ncbi:MAG: tyrosine-type recombinase/integrase [Polyangiaceae bacterium]|nr:tyrosine-type recombinase/integrase [Polyangiaceae bacterium]